MSGGSGVEKGLDTVRGKINIGGNQERPGRTNFYPDDFVWRFRVISRVISKSLRFAIPHPGSMARASG